jgi:hypothetical protein
MAHHDLKNDMSPSDDDTKKTVNATYSAIVTAEVLSGNYKNIQNGMTIHLEGASKEQITKIVTAFFTGSKEGITINFTTSN